MNILTAGHKYSLDNFEGTGCQTIQFIEKIQSEQRFDINLKTGEVKIDENQGKLTTVNDGTTNEEVLAVLIDRVNYLNGKFPCRENSIVITHLETALLWLEKRGVEGTNNK